MSIQNMELLIFLRFSYNLNKRLKKHYDSPHIAWPQTLHTGLSTSSGSFLVEGRGTPEKSRNFEKVSIFSMVVGRGTRAMVVGNYVI